MPIEVRCPTCKARFRAPDKYAGKRVKCPGCQAAVTIPGPGAPAASASAGKSAQTPVAGQKEAGQQKAPVAGQKEAGQQKTPVAGQKKPGQQKAPVVEQKEAGQQKAPVAGQKEAGQQKTPVAEPEKAGQQKAPIVETKKVEPQKAAGSSATASAPHVRQHPAQGPTHPASSSKGPGGSSPAASTSQTGSSSAISSPVKDLAEDRWYVQAEEGEHYGPVPKEELDAWVAEGRVDGSCQVLCEGWPQWKWAEDVYPELAEPMSQENPFAAIVTSDTVMPVDRSLESPESSPQWSSEPTPSTDTAEESQREAAVTAPMREALAQTRPWVLLLAILGLLVAGLGSLAALGMLGMSLLTLSAPGILFGLVGLASYGLYLYAASRLYVYANRIGAFLRTKATADLEKALAAQKSFWKLLGIVTLVALGSSLLAGVLLGIWLVMVGTSVAPPV